jgi:hypothetical protein
MVHVEDARRRPGLLGAFKIGGPVGEADPGAVVVDGALDGAARRAVVGELVADPVGLGGAGEQRAVGPPRGRPAPPRARPRDRPGTAGRTGPVSPPPSAPGRPPRRAPCRPGRVAGSASPATAPGRRPPRPPRRRRAPARPGGWPPGGLAAQPAQHPPDAGADERPSRYPMAADSPLTAPWAYQERGSMLGPATTTRTAAPPPPQRASAGAAASPAGPGRARGRHARGVVPSPAALPPPAGRAHRPLLALVRIVVLMGVRGNQCNHGVRGCGSLLLPSN